MATPTEKVRFQNAAGETLAGVLHHPIGPARAHALFAHCFTCSMDIAAARRVSEELCRHGFAVLRFDFTGLGASEGEFAATNFSSNVDDLVCAADFLREQYEAPRLLVGHSLGGAAVLAAGGRIDEVEAIATIAAPAEPVHVLSHFSDDLDRIERDGEAEVLVAGRPFTLQKQFVDDLEAHTLKGDLASLKKALLVMHSPTDGVVGIENAERIYRAARGFKSFVTLANADHLLTRKADAAYAASVLAAWAERYVEAKEEPGPREEGSVFVEEYEAPLTQRAAARTHAVLADEPRNVGGALDAGMTPYELLLSGLGACTTMTLRMYAKRKGWPVDRISCELTHSKIHAEECERCEETDGKADRITRTVHIEGDGLTDEQRARLLEIAERCPVHRTLDGPKEILTTLA